MKLYESFIALPIILILFSCDNLIKRVQKVTSNTIVVIQPIGKYDKKLIDSVANKVGKFYQVKVQVNGPIDMPKAFYTNIKSPRYRADSIIRYLRRIKPDTVKYILGLTNYDIAITKKDKDGEVKKPIKKYTDWAIFGLGFTPGPSCIVSSKRLGNSRKIRTNRAQKIALHEFGHNLGLPHCPNLDCFMQDAAETIKTIDRVDFNLCQDCRKQIIGK